MRYHITTVCYHDIILRRRRYLSVRRRVPLVSINYIINPKIIIIII